MDLAQSESLGKGPVRFLGSYLGVPSSLPPPQIILLFCFLVVISSHFYLSLGNILG